MDATQMEMVLLLDVSGSMQGETLRLGESTWAIRQAVDDIEGRLTVLCYDSGPYTVVLARPGVRPDDRMFVPAATGGTVPTSSLKEAYRLLAESDVRNRMCVILTDGSWSYRDDCVAVIEAMNSVGVTTVMGLMGSAAGTDGHGCRHTARFAGPARPCSPSVPRRRDRRDGEVAMRYVVGLVEFVALLLVLVVASVIVAAWPWQRGGCGGDKLRPRENGARSTTCGKRSTAGSLENDEPGREAVRLESEEDAVELLVEAARLIGPLVPTASCIICGEAFTEAEWEVRHSPSDDPLAEAHEECCPDCNPTRAPDEGEEP